MATSKERINAINEYNKSHYSRVNFYLKKDRYEFLKELSGSMCISMSQFINEAIEEKIARIGSGEENKKVSAIDKKSEPKQFSRRLLSFDSEYETLAEEMAAKELDKDTENKSDTKSSGRRTVINF